MLTVERCREILGDDCTMSDAELELFRDQLHGLADVATTAFIEEQKRLRNAPQTALEAKIRPFRGQHDIRHDTGHDKEPINFQDAIRSLSEDERHDLEERAAIHEFDGGLDRKAAEHAAFCDWWRRKHRN